VLLILKFFYSQSTFSTPSVSIMIYNQADWVFNESDSLVWGTWQHNAHAKILPRMKK